MWWRERPQIETFWPTWNDAGQSSLADRPIRTLVRLSTMLRTFLTRGRHQKNALYLSVNVFSTKVLIEDAIFMGPPFYVVIRAKVQPLAVQRYYLHFSVILRRWVLVRPWESNPRPPTLQSSVLPTDLILPLSYFCKRVQSLVILRVGGNSFPPEWFFLLLKQRSNWETNLTKLLNTL